CEGDIACYVSTQWLPVSTFLRAYPRSPFADSAVNRALLAFRVVASVTDLRAAKEDYEPAAVRALVLQLDTVARLVPPPNGTLLLTRVAQLWYRFADYDRARS